MCRTGLDTNPVFKSASDYYYDGVSTLEHKTQQVDGENHTAA